MGIREAQREQRERTSRILIQAALELSAAQGYGSLSLRSVARKAGIAPTSFYRHFRDMDELGLAVVEQAQIAFGQCLDKARKRMSLPASLSAATPAELSAAINQMMRSWLDTFIDCVYGQGELLRLFLQERTGSSPPLRAAISAAFARVTRALAEDLERIGGQSGIRFQDLAATAEAVMTVACAGAMDELLGSTGDQADAVDRLARKLGFILVGSAGRE